MDQSEKESLPPVGILIQQVHILCDKIIRIGISFLCLRQIPHNFSLFPPTDILEWGYHTELKKRHKPTENLQTTQFKIDSGLESARSSHRGPQKYSLFSSVAIRSSCCRTWGGGGLSAIKESFKWSMILSITFSMIRKGFASSRVFRLSLTSILAWLIFPDDA